MEILFAPLLPLVNEPGRIGLIAFGFFVAAVLVYAVQRRLSWWLITAAASWALFAAWEYHCTVHKYNIRVDLFLIWPILLSTTIGGIWGLINPWLPQRPSPPSQ